jgi:carboxyl-terminal processing protease
MASARPGTFLLILLAVVAACTSTAGPTATPGGPSGTPPPTTSTESPATGSPGTGSPATGSPGPSSPGSSPSPTGSAPTSTLACDYVPGNPVAQLPSPEPEPTPSGEVPVPAPTDVPPATVEEQLEVLDDLAALVPERYLDPELNGVDWDALVAEYRAIVQQGHSEAALEVILNRLIAELGDEHSYVESPTTVREAEDQLAGEADYVGVGIYVQPVADADRAVILLVFPGSPAEAAGLRAHDAITAVDGQPVIAADGTIEISKIRGLPGTEVTLTIERPGEDAPRDVTMTRAPISGAIPVRTCLVPGTGIAYLVVPCLCDLTIPDRIRQALERMAQETQLTGIVLDNRINGGGDERILRSMLALFVDGYMGEFAGAEPRTLEIEGDGVAGSQDLPVVVLVGDGTASYGEVMSGILQATDDSVVVGTTTDGNVETLHGHSLVHGWRLWLAAEAFASADAEYGPWEDTGIVPDIEVPTRWDLFTEANDPALAAAVEALGD